jgi:choline-sulfatase
MADRPNVLFLMDDEHRADVLGYAGDEVVRTPNLDRLADEAVTFENAYTPSPRCVPARQCMMSGQLPRTCGCETYGEDLPPESMTFARRFAQYGYETVAAGKLHHPGPDKAQGWTTLIGRNGGCNVETVEDAPEVEGAARPGRAKWTDRKEVQRAGTGKPGVGWKDNTDEYRVRGALDYIESKFQDPHYDREAPDSPVMLKVSLSQPHYPYLTTEERFKYYLNRVDPYDDEREVAFDDHSFLSQRRLEVGRDGFGISREGDVSPREVRRATAAYYGMVETVDAYFGRVLEALEEAGENLDEWIVVYTADHGEMLGQHGVWEKGHFFEASARVPLVIRWPERLDARRVSANVSLCDLFATLCDLAGIPLPADHALDSRSLVPLAEGSVAGAGAWTDESVSAYGDDLMVKRGDLKFMQTAEGSDVLFDLAEDPGETENRVDDPAYADAVAAFRERCAELGYGPDADDSDGGGAGYEPGVAG